MPLPNSMLARRVFLPALIAATVILGVVGFGQPANNNNAYTLGTPATGQKGVSRTTADVMTEQAARGPKKYTFTKRELLIPGRANRPQNPAAKFDKQFPPATNNASTSSAGIDHRSKFFSDHWPAMGRRNGTG